MALGVFVWSLVNAFVKQVVCHEVRNYNAATTANAVGRDSELFPWFLVSAKHTLLASLWIHPQMLTTFTMDQILICQQFQLMHPILNSLVHLLSLWLHLCHWSESKYWNGMKRLGKEIGCSLLPQMGTQFQCHILD
jgi:hypothetical protein